MAGDWLSGIRFGVVFGGFCFGGNVMGGVFWACLSCWGLVLSSVCI